MKTVRFISILILLLIFSCVSIPTTITKVLFIGSSMIYSNDMPAMFKEIAESMGKTVLVEHSTAPGEQLSEHVVSEETIAKIGSRQWDYVILFELNTILLNRDRHEGEMHRPIKQIMEMATESGSTVYLMTPWAAARGGFVEGQETFEKMQNYMINETQYISDRHGIERIPVGDGWGEFHSQYPEVDLWGRDSAHPDYAGTYLSAALLYRYIYNEPITESDFIPEMVPPEVIELVKTSVIP